MHVFGLAYQRSAPSWYFLLPSTRLWTASEVLVSTPRRNYTIDDMEQLFDDASISDGVGMWQNVNKLVHAFEQPPGVEVHNLHGVNVSTESAFVYAKQDTFPNEQPTSIVYDNDGDGWINSRSLTVYKQWIGKQAQPVLFEQFPGVQHDALLSFEPAIAYIVQLAFTP